MRRARLIETYEPSPFAESVSDDFPIPFHSLHHVASTPAKYVNFVIDLRLRSWPRFISYRCLRTYRALSGGESGPAVVSRINSKPGYYYESTYFGSDSLLSAVPRSKRYLRDQRPMGSQSRSPATGIPPPTGRQIESPMGQRILRPSVSRIPRPFLFRRMRQSTGSFSLRVQPPSL